MRERLGYLEKYFCGVSYLDPVSWLYYLPVFMGYTFSNSANPSSMVVDASSQPDKASQQKAEVDLYSAAGFNFGLGLTNQFLGYKGPLRRNDAVWDHHLTGRTITKKMRGEQDMD